ncbi:MAG: hypothetical protein ACNA8K_09055 [Cyclonatronaceae bacterium]
MVLRNPIDIEHAYRELIRTDATSPSCAARLGAISDFLELAGDPEMYESYILDVLRILQVPPGPGTLTGKDPAALQNLISRLERCRTVVPEAMMELYLQDLARLRRHTALTFFHLGEQAKMLSMLGLPEADAERFISDMAREHQMQDPGRETAADEHPQDSVREKDHGQHIQGPANEKDRDQQLKDPAGVSGLDERPQDPAIQTGLDEQLQNPAMEIEKELVREMDLKQNLRHPVYDTIDSAPETLINLKNRLYKSGEASVAGEVRKLAGMLEAELQEMAKSVMVPVVEWTSRGKSTGYGRLRRVSLDLDLSRSAEKDDIRVSVSSPGSRSGVENQVSVPLKAARRLADATIPGIRKRFVRGILDFNMPGAYHEGESANLAIAALFCSELWRLSGKREYYQLAGRLAITGGLDEEGNVLDIDEEGIATKLKAAFYSSITHLVVPAHQEEIFRAEVKKLSGKWPRRHLEITGIRTLQEIFYDRRLTEYKRIPASILAGTWMRKYGFSSAGLILLLVLSALLAMAWYGPIDKNPVMGEYQGQYLVVKNRLGQTITKIDVGEETIRYYAVGFKLEDVHSFADLTGDGINEVIWIQFTELNDNNYSVIRAKNIGTGDILWEYYTSNAYRFPGATDYVDHHYIFVHVIPFFDREAGRTDFLVLKRHQMFFPSFIKRINGSSGDVISSYYHPGAIHDLILIDEVGDGHQNIYFGGTNNSYNMAVMGILEPNQMDGQAIGYEQHRIDGYENAAELVYLRIPPTILGQSMESLSRRNIVSSLNSRSDAGIVEISLEDNMISREHQVTSVFRSLIGYFTTQLEPIGFGTSDRYDDAVDLMITEGLLEARPTPAYFREYMGQIEYLIDGQWISWEDISSEF